MAQYKHNKPCAHRHSDLWWPSKAHKPVTDRLQFVDLHLQKGLSLIHIVGLERLGTGKGAYWSRSVGLKT